MNAINLHAHRFMHTDLRYPYNGVTFVDLNTPRNSQFQDLDRRLPVTSGKDVLKFCVGSLNSDGGKPLQPGRAEKEGGSETSLSANDKLTKSAKQEKITALFRRILSSISKAEAKRAKLTQDNFSQESQPGSTQKVHQQSQKQVKVSATTKSRKGDQELPRKQRFPRNKDKIQVKTQHSAASFSTTRPTSNFVKKSPIPRPSIIRGKPKGEEKDLPLEQMKLTQLKEMAKSRAIKGYSKLKKGQLLELLSS
ncbi:Rho termination factor [Euphorbia peplus]|nr:Rho termination factor [Euphorbia peplus]